MVLGFGSRSTKKKGANGGERVVRLSPSLPDMSSGALVWPSDLVDVAAIRETPPQTPAPGATKVSFSHPDHGTIPFHRPFRVSSGRPSSPNGGHSAGPIASMFMSRPPSAFDPKVVIRAGTPHSTRTRRSHSQRRRVAPTFNLMVAGAQGTGKSSLLRLLIDTADISPTASAEQRASIDQFLRTSGKRTERIDTACVEICESRFDRILLSVIDTPGLDFHEGRELKLERQVSRIVKYLDVQFADTMDEESKVVRKSKGDQHVHLCIYLIDPDSVMAASTRRGMSVLPLKSDSSSLSEQDDDRFAMDPADLRVIRRLSERVNVLPIIARSDILTDEKLAAVKLAVRRGLHKAKLGFSVFGPVKVDDETSDSSRPSTSAENGNGVGNGDANGSGSGDGQHMDEGFGGEESEEDERRSRSVIKLNQSRRPLARSSSRSRLEMNELEDKRAPMPLSEADPDSLASVRFSAAYFAHSIPKLTDVMPFAVIMPEQTVRVRRALKPPPSRPASAYSAESGAYPQTPNGDNSTDEGDRGTPTPTATPKSPSTDHLPYSRGPPRDLKGVFVRRFRWGVVDVLDPTHCEFAALRTAVLSTHFKVLKTNTKEVLYEKYRTEKLLARRATRNISDEDRKRLLEDLGL
ncbi:hypothetical protein M0805_002338 [Coniferiporia weirii]|nr:hypothetical protein M0805_002338 [Coniferiporia weirii]